MYIDQRKLQEATILDLCGRFDETDHEGFIKTIEDLQSGGCRRVVINLSSLYFLDPMVIDLLHFAHDYFQASSADFSLVSPLSAVRNELVLANVTDMIPTYESVYDALHRPHTDAHKMSSSICA